MIGHFPVPGPAVARAARRLAWLLPAGAILMGGLGTVGGGRPVAAAATQIYTMTKLGTLPRGLEYDLEAVNEKRQVVGTYTVGTDLTDPNKKHRGLIWDPVGGLRDIGMPEGADQVFVNDINDDGIAVGTAKFADATRAFLWQNDVFTLLPAVDSEDASAQDQATGINNAGVVVGTSSGAAVKWVDRQPISLAGNMPDGTFGSSATAINGEGTIVGTLDGDDTEGFILPVGQATAVPFRSLGGFDISPNAVNNSRVIVGSSEEVRDEDVFKRATGWAPPSFAPVALTSPSDVDNSAEAINSQGTVVGFAALLTGANAGRGGAFIRSASGQLTFLLDLLTNLDEQHFPAFAGDINDRGDIVGEGIAPPAQGSRFPTLFPYIATLGAASGGGGVDKAKPVLKAPKTVPASPVSAAGGAVTLSVQATDNAGVSSVHAAVTGPGGFTAEADLTRTAGTDKAGTWSGPITLPANATKTPQSYSVTFTAKDAADNAATLPLTVKVNPDKTAPVLSQPAATPAGVQAGQPVTLSVRATDVLPGVATVQAKVQSKGSPTTVTLTLNAGGSANDGTWQGSFTPTAGPVNAGTFTVTFSATDGAGNAAKPVSTTFQLTKETVPPALSGLTVTPAVVANADKVRKVAFSVQATDNLGVKSVQVVVAGTVSGKAMRLTVKLTPNPKGTPASGTWSGTLVMPKNPTATDAALTVQLTAVDVSGNQTVADGPALTLRGVSVAGG
jgi:hypothetical protein